MAITVKHKFVSAIPDGTDATIVRPSNWNDDHDLTGTIPVANGGTGASTAADGLNNLLPSQTGNNGKVLATDGTNATWTTNGSGDVVGPASATDNAVARFDSTTGKLIKNSGVTVDNNNNIAANALDDAYTNTAASGTLITLTVASPRRYTITGSGGQVIKLPDATTLTNGTVFQFDNNQSSGAITVNNNSNTLVVSVPSGGFVLVNLLSNAIAAGSWDRHDQAPSNVSWSTNTFDYAGSITSATWNGNAVAVNRGGTGQSTYTDGQLLIGNSTGNTLTKSTLTAGTGISVTNSAGAITIANTSPSSGGTVTSVAATVPSFLSVTGSPITTSGTLALTYSGTALPVLNGGTGVTTSTGTGAVVLGTRPTMSVTGAGFTLQDATDTTKTANFDLTGLTAATNYTYALPATTGSTIALLGATQTFTAAQTIGSGITFTALGTANISGSVGSATSLGTSATTGTLTAGGTAQTGILTIGRSTVSQTTNIQAGITASGSTKAINIGTAGASGSTTTIIIGSTTGTSTTTVNAILKQQTYTVATLPSASTSGVGSRSFVTDALAPTFGATVVTGGAIAVPVYSDGTNWKVG